MEIPGKMEGLLGKSWKKTIGTLKYIKFEGMNRNYLMSCADGLNSCKCLQEGIQPSSPSILFTLLFSQRMLQSPIKFHGFNPTSISKAQFGSILGVSQNRATQLPLVIIHFRLRFSQTQKPSSYKPSIVEITHFRKPPDLALEVATTSPQSHPFGCLS